MRHGRRDGFHTRSPRVSTRGFLCGCQAWRAGLTPSGRRPAKRTAARCRGFACIMLPGFHPGLLVRVPGLEGRVDSKRAAARQANHGTKPRVRVHHAPGFPPGASWTGDETDRLCTGGQKYDSLQDPCSGAALLSSSVQQQNSRLRLQGTEPPNPTDRNATPVPRGRLAQRRGEMCELRPFPTREARRSETAASEGPTSGIVSPTA